uniref:Uncharacterized protein n=1 Tax=Zea mays TaxID=4577 RepID=A0A804PBQ1_MAIZE
PHYPVSLGHCIASRSSNGVAKTNGRASARVLRLVQRFPVSRSGGRGDVHVREPVHGHGVAGRPVQRRQPKAGADGVRAPAGRGTRGAGAGGLVRPHVGAHGLLPGRRHGAARLCHGRLRLWLRRVRGRGRCAAGHAGRVHARRQWRAGLLRRQPRGWLQPPRAGGDLRRRRLQRAGVVRGGRVRSGPERDVPRRAPSRGRRRVPERVRRVRAARVLLQRRLRDPGGVPADCLLAGVQERVPALLQLRLRRSHLHIHLRRRPRLHRHLLPRRHPKPEVDDHTGRDAGDGAGDNDDDGAGGNADAGRDPGYADGDHDATGRDVHGRHPGQRDDADGWPGHRGRGPRQRAPGRQQQRRQRLLARQHGHRRRGRPAGGFGSVIGGATGNVALRPPFAVVVVMEGAEESVGDSHGGAFVLPCL